METLLNSKKLSKWIKVEGHCWTRIVEGGDYNNISDRVAFIEKSPRVRTGRDEVFDFLNDTKHWRFETIKDKNYDSTISEKDWCDRELRIMGYELSD